MRHPLPFPVRALPLVAAIAFACSDADPVRNALPDAPEFRLLVTGPDAAPGDTVVAALAVDAGVTAGVQGEIRYAPETAEYLGQAVAEAPLLMVRAEPGRLRFVVLDPRGLRDTPIRLGFRVKTRGFVPGLSAALSDVADLGGHPVRGWRSPGPRSPMPGSRGRTGSSARLDLVSWYRLLGREPSTSGRSCSRARAPSTGMST
ncbi:MAG: hypothetical protein R2882_04190 [Gemmatimonadales bacterium]